MADTQDGTQLLIALEECELKIRTAAKRGLEAKITIGIQLDKISRDQLYTARAYDDFVQYAESELGIGRTGAYSCIQIAKAISELKARALPMPESESQILELVKVGDADYQGQIWLRTRELCDKLEKPVTANRIRLVARDENEKAEADKPPAADPQGAGVEVDLDGFGPVEQANVAAGAVTAAPVGLKLSEKGERALDRIGRLCGDSTQEAIEGLAVQISQRDLITWAEQDDQTVRNLSHYVLNERWSVAQALKYEARVVTGATTIDDLIRLCLARGGAVSIVHEGGNNRLRITVETL